MADYNKPGPRHLDAQGLAFSIIDFAVWNRAMFAGICVAHGCNRETAEQIAEELERCRYRATTVRPLNFNALRPACKIVGVRVEEIPPL